MLKIHVNKKSESKIRRNFPYIFNKDITKFPSNPQNGALTAIYTSNNNFLALALWDTHNPSIPARLLSKQRIIFNEQYLKNTFEIALAKRLNNLEFKKQNNAYRILNGENDAFPGIILDNYNNTWVLKIYTASWLPYINSLIHEVIEPYKPDRLIIRTSRNLKQLFKQNNLPNPNIPLAVNDEIKNNPTTTFIENGAIFQAYPLHGQKTGFFLDQRETRLKIRQIAKDKKILDLCCYSGAFSINAALGNASEIHSLDADKHALELLQKHYELNAHNIKTNLKKRFIHADIFQWLKNTPKTNAKYDLVIADPPSFTNSQQHIDKAIIAYKKLTTLAAKHIKPGGQLLACSCSSRINTETFQKIIKDTISQRFMAADPIMGLPFDHPTTFKEAEYLKAWLITLS